MKKIILERAIAHYGLTAQHVVAMEELSELIKEISKSFRGGLSRMNMAEEIADVLIMIEQLKIMNNIKEEYIQDVINEKLMRLERRMDKEDGNE